MIAIIFAVIATIVSRGGFKFTIKEEETRRYLPYEKKPSLMTNAEKTFFKVLESTVQGRYYIIPQVQLSNLVQPEKGKERDYAVRNKIDRKSVDFVLFNKDFFTPYLVIELDDSTHKLSSREIRDDFVNSILNKVGIKLIRIPVAKTYDLSNIMI